MAQPRNPVCPECGEAVGATTGDGTTDDAASDPTPGAVGDYGTIGDAATEGGATGRNLVQSAARIGAVLLTVLVGAVTTLALMILTAEVAEVWIPLLLVALVGIVTGGVVVARRDTGIDALADALYVTAAVLVGLPFAFVLLLPTGDPILEKALGGLVFSFFGAFIGVPAFGLGYVLQPDDE